MARALYERFRSRSLGALAWGSLLPERALEAPSARMVADQVELTGYHGGATAPVATASCRIS
jgi:hypothetical protein